MHHNPTRFLRSRGFTLIELLTVIAIIGILVAIIVPVVGKVRSSARQATCASNMRQLLIAVPLYAADNKDKLPACYFGDVNGEVAYQLGPYASPPQGLPAIEIVRWVKKTLTCSVEGWGFAFNSWSSELRMSSIKEPTRLAYLMDHTSASSVIRPVTFTGLPTDFTQKTPRPHNAKVNVGFLDAHVERRLASTLTWADFTRGTPSYLSSHETRMVTTADYDK